MPKYRVVDRFHVWYEVIVEADDEEAAGEKADKMSYWKEVDRSLEDSYVEELDDDSDFS